MIQFVGWIARMGAVAILAIGYAVVITQLFPRSATVNDLINDLRSGSASEYFCHVNGFKIELRWSTSIVTVKEAVYPASFEGPGTPDSPDVVVEMLAKQPGIGPDVAYCRDFDPNLGLGGLRTFMPILYVWLIPWALLRRAVIIVGLMTLASTLLPKHRRVDNNFAWFWLCVLFVFGFWAYLWCEPVSLPQALRLQRDKATVMTGFTALRATILAAALLIVASILLVKI